MRGKVRRLSSGGCVQGAKSPLHVSSTGFSNFSSLKNRTQRGEKTFCPAGLLSGNKSTSPGGETFPSPARGWGVLFINERENEKNVTPFGPAQKGRKGRLHSLCSCCGGAALPRRSIAARVAGGSTAALSLAGGGFGRRLCLRRAMTVDPVPDILIDGLTAGFV